MLLQLKEEKPNLTTLCGLKPEQSEANFCGWGLTPQDAKLLAPEILVHASLTSLDLKGNQLCGVGRGGHGTYTAEGIKAIADALRVSASVHYSPSGTSPSGTPSWPSWPRQAPSFSQSLRDAVKRPRYRAG